MRNDDLYLKLKNGAPCHFNPQQLEALDRIEEWLSSGEQQVFYLAGYAGTGKTTIAAEVATRVDGPVLFASFTGKAAAVMREKGCAGACTIDSLIYHPQLESRCVATPPCDHPPCNDECQYFRERHAGRELNPDSAVANARLVIIDECSMVGEQMGRDLLSYGAQVLVLGDNAQLQPIEGAGFFTARVPDFQLTEIQRQALASPVIQLATIVRNRDYGSFKVGQYGDSEVRRPLLGKLRFDEMITFDQVICGTNRTRLALNQSMRKALGFTGNIPQVGEKLMCLKNDKSRGLYNGTIWTVKEVAPPSKGVVPMTIRNDEGLSVGVHAPEVGFMWPIGSGSGLPGQPFTFAYVITCHKAQGSQWGSVAIVNQCKSFREDSHRWLYTAITRAVDRVVIM
jgi:exodeoxyribonuclease-5